MFGRAVMILTILALAVAPARALATPLDVAATHAYIRANYAFVSTSEAKTGPTQAKVEAFNRQLGHECPNVGAGSPEDEASQPVSHEVAVALWSVSYGIDAGAIRTFVHTVRRLRWSNQRLTRIAHDYATDLTELATLPLPNLCGDVRAWKASGFTTVPADASSLVQRVEAIELKTIPPSLLAPYEQPADRGILARTIHLETKLEQFEVGTGFSDWDLVLGTLGLNQ
jgi:hypothetical protein